MMFVCWQMLCTCLEQQRHVLQISLSLLPVSLCAAYAPSVPGGHVSLANLVVCNVKHVPHVSRYLHLPAMYLTASTSAISCHMQSVSFVSIEDEDTLPSNLFSVVLQALILQGDIIRFLVVALLIVFIVLESMHKLVRQHSRPEFIASAVIGAICSALMLAQGIYLLHVLRQVHKLHRRWCVWLSISSCMLRVSPSLENACL